MIKHTKGEWAVMPNHEAGYASDVKACPNCICDEDGMMLAVCVADCIPEHEGNAELFAMSKTAPHECDDPQCPGNINRQKLALFEEMVEALKTAKARIGCGCGRDSFPCGDCDSLDDSIYSLLTKSEAINPK